jgi:hypothetical protein
MIMIFLIINGGGDSSSSSAVYVAVGAVAPAGGVVSKYL